MRQKLNKLHPFDDGELMTIFEVARLALGIERREYFENQLDADLSYVFEKLDDYMNEREDAIQKLYAQNPSGYGQCALNHDHYRDSSHCVWHD